MMKTVLLSLAVSISFLGSLSAAPTVTAERTESGVRVLIDGKVFTEYFGAGAQRPYLYPIIGPSGANLARPYPMEKGGAEDHPHHRSLWFAHGAVNGVDFWADGDKHGRQVHAEVKSLEATANSATFSTSTNWLSSGGDPMLTDERRIVIAAGEDGSRRIDFTITLKASHGQVVLGDTKEGTFALRVCPSLSFEGEGAAGHILNSNGKKDKSVWGKPAPWVSYFGPDPKNEPVTITIFDHPSNLRHPTWWHARTYGLFAANPFGKHDFEKLEDKTAGDYKLAAGETLTLTYRVLIAAGDPDSEKLKTEFANFSSGGAK